MKALLNKALDAFHAGNMLKASQILTVRDFVARMNENLLSIKVIGDFLKVVVNKEPLTLNVETNDNGNKTEKPDEKTNGMYQQNVEDMEFEEGDLQELDRHSMDMLDDFDDENEGIEVNDDPPSPGSV